MSWHASIIAVQGDVRDRSSELFNGMGLGNREADGEVDFDRATSLELDGSAVGYRRGWTIISDSLFFISSNRLHTPENALWPLPVHSTIEELSQDHTTWGFLLEGSSGTFGFSKYAGGTMQRCWIAWGSETVMDQGQPIQEESDLEASDNEERILKLLEKAVLPLKELQALNYTLYR